MAGTMDIDLATEPLGSDADGKPVYLRDIWPTAGRGRSDVIAASINAEMFTKDYADVFAGDERWQVAADARPATRSPGTPSRPTCASPRTSTAWRAQPAPVTDIAGARVLAKLGDSVTTDHISPAGSIKADSPAGKYLAEHGVERKDFNSYGSRRGNHEVMIRGTFANIRLRNQLAPGTEGGFTRDFTAGRRAGHTIYDAAQDYQAAGIPLVVLAGKEYGSGSSRDWAAKGTALLGVKAVIAESYERIHRSNLIGMGVLPLQYPAGQTAESLGLTGRRRSRSPASPRSTRAPRPKTVKVTHRHGGVEFDAVVRIDTPGEADYYRHGGILQYVLRQMIAS